MPTTEIRPALATFARLLRPGVPRGHILIDYENVQPVGVPVFGGLGYCVTVYLGANQTRISAELAMALQQQEHGGRFVRMTRSGHNALDFLITCHVGEIVKANPDAIIRIVTKDTGFDPLIGHLHDQGIDIARIYSPAEAPGIESRATRIADALGVAALAGLRSTTRTISAGMRTLSASVRKAPALPGIEHDA